MKATTCSARGRETRPFLGQGVRYGIAVSVLAVIPMYLIYYAVQRMPEALVAKQIVFDTSGYIVMGVVLPSVTWAESAIGPGR